MIRTWEEFKRSDKGLLTVQLFVQFAKKSLWKIKTRLIVRAGPNSDFWAKDVRAQLMTNNWLVQMGRRAGGEWRTEGGRKGGVYRQMSGYLCLRILFSVYKPSELVSLRDRPANWPIKSNVYPRGHYRPHDGKAATRWWWRRRRRRRRGREWFWVYGS